MRNPAPPSAPLSWGSYWNRAGLWAQLSSIYRRLFAQREVRKYCDREFAQAGWFMEAGCGSGESAVRIPRRQRRFIALDLAAGALLRARTVGFYDQFLLGDLLRLPLATGSLDGIWNVGVMEHFAPADMPAACQELLRVLKPGGKLCLFWPHTLSPTHLVFGQVQTMVQNFKPDFSFFPPSPSMLTPFNRPDTATMLRTCGASAVRFHLSWVGGGLHYLVAVTK